MKIEDMVVGCRYMVQIQREAFPMDYLGPALGGAAVLAIGLQHFVLPPETVLFEVNPQKPTKPASHRRWWRFWK